MDFEVRIVIAFKKEKKKSVVLRKRQNDDFWSIADHLLLWMIITRLFGGGFGGLVARSCPTLAISWTVTCQAPLSIGFSRQEYWSGLPFPPPGDLPDPGIEPWSPALYADALPSELTIIVQYYFEEKKNSL